MGLVLLWCSVFDRFWEGSLPFKVIGTFFASGIVFLIMILIARHKARQRNTTLSSLASAIPSRGPLSLFSELQRRQSTDNKDKYFAVVGLISVPIEGSHFQESIDATSSIYRIYKQLFMDLVGVTGSLDLLLYSTARFGIASDNETQYANRNPALWIIDWQRDPVSAKCRASDTWVRTMWWLSGPRFLGNTWVQVAHRLGLYTGAVYGLNSYSGVYLSLNTRPLFQFRESDKLLVRGTLLSGGPIYASTPFSHVRMDSQQEALLASVESFQFGLSGLPEQRRLRFIECMAMLVQIRVTVLGLIISFFRHCGHLRTIGR